MIVVPLGNGNESFFGDCLMSDVHDVDPLFVDKESQESR